MENGSIFMDPPPVKRLCGIPVVQVRVPILEVVFSHSCGAKGWRVRYIDPYLVGKLALPATSRCMGRHTWYTVYLVKIAGERCELLQRVSLY